MRVNKEALALSVIVHRVRAGTSRAMSGSAKRFRNMEAACQIGQACLTDLIAPWPQSSPVTAELRPLRVMASGVWSVQTPAMSWPDIVCWLVSGVTEQTPMASGHAAYFTR